MILCAVKVTTTDTKDVTLSLDLIEAPLKYNCGLMRSIEWHVLCGRRFTPRPVAEYCFLIDHSLQFGFRQIEKMFGDNERDLFRNILTAHGHHAWVPQCHPTHELWSISLDHKYVMVMNCDVYLKKKKSFTKKLDILPPWFIAQYRSYVMFCRWSRIGHTASYQRIILFSSVRTHA